MGEPASKQSKTFAEIRESCAQMLDHRERLARPRLEGMVLDAIGTSTDNGDLLAHLLCSSLMSRVDRQLMEQRNIYVEQFDIPQIELFYLTSRAYPHIPLAHDLANGFLSQQMRELEHVALFEIGIGKGAQLERLLKSIAAPGSATRRVDVLALDPDPNNLADSRARLARTADQLGLELVYEPLEGLLETLELGTLQARRRALAENLFINSAFTLHHTMHAVGDRWRRNQILANLHALGPRLITLVEPNADHDVEDLRARCSNCWQHFGAVFELIDNSDLSPAQRFAIKEKFFGREIRDIFGVADSHRCERHESFESWLLRLWRAGFRPGPRLANPPVVDSICELEYSDGLVRLSYQGLPLIAVFAYEGHPQ
jgi:hypothetical protein